MKTAAALWEHVREHDLCPGSRTLEEWRGVRWIRMRFGPRLVPVLPVIGYRAALHLHDVHHILTGYDTRLRGELELAAWELGSGGCGWSLVFWIDRLLGLLLGLVLCPVRLLRAFRRGLGCRNLYGERVDRVLEEDLQALARRVGLAR